MPITGTYGDQEAMIAYDTNLHRELHQTNFRCQAFVGRDVFPNGKGVRMAVNRTFSEGLMQRRSDVYALIEPNRATRYDRRWIRTAIFDSVEYVSKDLMEETLRDPRANLQKAQIETMNRTLDYYGVRAMFDNVEVGPSEDDITSISFAADEGMTIDMTGGATYEKLLEIKETLIDKEVINEGKESLWMSIDGKMHTQLLNQIELTSGDYTTEQNAQLGEINVAAGIKLIRFGSQSNTPILPVSGGIRTGFCIVGGDALTLYTQREFTTRIDEDPLRHDTWRIRSNIRFGFMRMSGRRILKVNTVAT